MLEAIFAPRSIAVVGASPDPTKLGHRILKNILDAGYPGRIFPVHPGASHILGFPAYPSVEQVPEPVDLAVIVVPATVVPNVAEACGRAGVKGLVVISAGFKEVGPEGRALEMQLLEIVQRYGMRMIGPNCLGIIDTITRLNASFAALYPHPGQIAFMSQSGALCTAILDWSKAQGIGFSRFVSLGNKADVDEVTLLEAWGCDQANNRVILAYLEGIGNGDAFVAVARRVTKRIPVIAIKSGATQAGARAASSHTGALAGAEHACEAAFDQSGVLRARSMQELFDFAMAFAYQPLIPGNRLAIVTNAGGPGIIATDAAERIGLHLAELTPATMAALRAALPSTASVSNPIDIIGDARPDRYRVALRAALDDPYVDAVLVLFTPQAVSKPEDVARTIVEVAAGSAKPVVTSFMGAATIGEALRILNDHRIPNYAFPERAIAALGAMVAQRHWVERPPEEYVRFDVDAERVRALFTRVCSEGRVELGELEAREVIEAYGMRLPKSLLAQSPEEAAEIAARLGFPVVMKISSPDILHKSDIGGVKLGIGDSAAARDAYELIEYRARKYSREARIWGVLVQEQVRKGREVLVGVSRDPQFGPLIAFGLGGIYVEALRDVAFRLAPVSRQEAAEQVRAIRAFPLLRGVRGEPPADIAAAEEVILRVSQLVTDFPEIVEMDINPLVVYNRGEGATVLDARIILRG
ncbi:acetate--CoA ligase alpha subunit [Roseiflexus castenholzii]|jgi:acetyltransferase|uniref:Acetyl coenzyme A synthetase (ADP forming) alpha domain n=1 Tax=Roseiflexus castenholzii (strain DSM 13941 / HLO8) TaxID=383372 RepID=A7NFJ1_ROSCS|nr:acetate--CoA ligase [Roseiflexus castenholzii]ABU56213.1 Acetyl coenzyme A synthetase (ADP forming) alpha domain [Roseiflexus castenholzii DSM 13941]